MFARKDRSIGNGTLRVALLLTVLAGAGILFWWLHQVASRQAAPLQRGEESAPARPDVQLRTITLAVPDTGGLEAVPISIPKQHEVQLNARAAVAALLTTDRAAPSLLSAFGLRGLYLNEAGTAYVDLAAVRQEPGASAREELLFLYAVVNTLTGNFPEVREVRFLVDGREAQTLAGHVDVARAYTGRPDLARP